jgi:hypothetical protein
MNWTQYIFFMNTYSPPDTIINDPGEFNKICNDLHQSYYNVINKELNIEYR